MGKIYGKCWWNKLHQRPLFILGMLSRWLFFKNFMDQFWPFLDILPPRVLCNKCLWVWIIIMNARWTPQIVKSISLTILLLWGQNPIPAPPTCSLPQIPHPICTPQPTYPTKTHISFTVLLLLELSLHISNIFWPEPLHGSLLICGFVFLCFCLGWVRSV